MLFPLTNNFCHSFPQKKEEGGGGCPYAPMLLVCHENVTKFECLGGREESTYVHNSYLVFKKTKQKENMTLFKPFGATLTGKDTIDSIF